MTRRRAMVPFWLTVIAVMLVVVACGEEEELGAGSASGTTSTTTPVDVTPPATPTATENLPPATPTPIDENDPFVQQAQMYADDLDITLEEAIERLGQQEMIGTLNGQLELNERETFAGAFLQHEPEYRFVVLFTRDGEETIRKYVEEDSVLDELVEVRAARFSLDELQEIRDEADAILGQLEHGMGSSGTDVTENRVVYYVYNVEQVEGLLADAGLVLPEGVALVDNGGPPVSFEPPEQIPGIYIAIRIPHLGGGAHPDALLTGNLVLADGCLLVAPDFEGDPYLPVWPHDARLRVEGDLIEVINGDGAVIARVGEPVFMGGAGGGIITSEGLHHPVPEACQGQQAWYVGGIDPLAEQPVIPTPVPDGAPLGLHTVAWPDDFEGIESLLAAMPDTYGDQELPRWDGPTDAGRYEIGYGSPDDPNLLRFTIIDLTTGTYYPDFWTVNDLIASRFMGYTGMSNGFTHGISWATEDTATSGRSDAVYPDTTLHAFHWGNDPATWLFSAYASDKDVLEEFVVQIVAVGTG